MIFSFFRDIIVDVFYFRNCNFEKPDVRNFPKNLKLRMIYEGWFFVTTEIINQICLVLQTLKHQNVSNWFIGGFVHVQ